MKHSLLEQCKTIILILIGNAVLAFAIAAFILPARLIAGGTTGLALLGEHFFGLRISLSVLIVNIVMFVLGFWILGKKFALTTILSPLIYPLFLDVFSSMDALQDLSDDLLLSAVYAGLLIGVGIGLVIKAGASTGGMDIPPLILQKKYDLPVSVTLYLFDTTILLAQMAFSSTSQVLHGIMVVLLTSLVINKVLLFGKGQMQMLIISDRYEEIKDAFLHDLDCGVTLVDIETGWGKVAQKAVLSVLSHRKLTEAKQIVMRIDDKAFMMINETTEVHGRGYTIAR